MNNLKNMMEKEKEQRQQVITSNAGDSFWKSASQKKELRGYGKNIVE